MSSINIENIMNNIEKKIGQTKSYDENFLNLIALELSKLNVENRNAAIEQLIDENF